MTFAWMETVLGLSLWAGLATVGRNGAIAEKAPVDRLEPLTLKLPGLPGPVSVRMADGGIRTLASLRPGDGIAGRRGTIRVKALEHLEVHPERLYGLNGSRAFLSLEQPVLTLEGWKALDPGLAAHRQGGQSLGRLVPGDMVAMHTSVLDRRAGRKPAAPSPAGGAAAGGALDYVLLSEIHAEDWPPHTDALTLHLEGLPFLFVEDFLIQAQSL